MCICQLYEQMFIPIYSGNFNPQIGTGNILLLLFFKENKKD